MKLFLILSVFLANQISDKLNDLQFIRCKLDIAPELIVENNGSSPAREVVCTPKNKN